MVTYKFDGCTIKTMVHLDLCAEVILIIIFIGITIRETDLIQMLIDLLNWQKPLEFIGKNLRSIYRFMCKQANHIVSYGYTFQSLVSPLIRYDITVTG